MSPNTTRALKRASHPAFLVGTLLTGVGVAFNVSHGLEVGGSDELRRAGMAALFFAAIVAKDFSLGKIFTSLKARRYGLAVACFALFALGALASGVAAIGAASEGREEKSDPRQAQIDAYNVAKKIAAESETRLGEIGTVATAAEVEANVARILATVDASIARRTSGCSVIAPNGAGKRQVAVNGQACEPVQAARADLARAHEAETLRAKLDEAREVIAKGAPKSADATVATISAIMSKFSGVSGEMAATTLLVLIAAVFVEIGGPIAWTVFQLSAPARSPERLPTFSEMKADADLAAFRDSLAQRLPERNGPTVAEVIAARRFPETDPTPPKPRKRMKPTFSGDNVVTLADHPVVKAIKENGGSVASNRQLAKLMGVSDGEATKRRAEIEHMISVEKIGKECRIALVAG